MLDFFMQVQQSSGDAGGGTFNGLGTYPSTPTHMVSRLNDTNTKHTGLSIWDISTPSSPTITATWDSGNNNHRDSTSFTISGTNHRHCIKDNICYYWTDGTGGARIEAFDVSNVNSLSISDNVDTLTDTVNFVNARRLFAHPTKDILWFVTSSKIITIDISNPASMSTIIVYSPGYTIYTATMSGDGEYLFTRESDSDHHTYQLNASNEPSNRATVISAYDVNSSHAMDVFTSTITGDNYWLQGRLSSDKVAITEMGSGYTVLDTHTVGSPANFDDVRAVQHLDYYSNYSTSDSFAFFANGDDDDKIVISSFDDSSNTLTDLCTQVNTTYGDNHSCTIAVDQYIYALSQGSMEYAVWEWSALNTLSLIASGTTTYRHLSFVPYAP